VRKKFISLLKNIPDLYQEVESIEVSLYHFIDNLDETQMIYVYYKCDFFRLILNNPKIENIFNTMLQSPATFNSLLSKDTPPDFVPLLELLASLVDKFILVKAATPNRTVKYNIRRRRGIILSDTDSIVINLQPYVKKISERFFLRNNLNAAICEHLAYNNEAMCFKIVNIMNYLCTYVTKVTANIFCKASNIPEELRKWISMKNEYYFMRIIMYINAKKNYICYVKLNEGKIQDEVTATGIKLNSSVINTSVHDKIMHTILNDILKSENVNPSIILRNVKRLEYDVITNIMNGDTTYGRKGRYSGPQGYKTVKKNQNDKKPKEEIPGLYTNNTGRSCYIWNLLYPSSKINVGDYAYIFNLTLEDEDDIDKKMAAKYPCEAEQIKSLIYHNPDEPHLARYGLRSIAIPITDTVTSIPQWIIDFIDYVEITNKTLQPIVSLLPSIGIHKSRISSTKSTYSPLVTF
jgi:hypothetical protein